MKNAILIMLTKKKDNQGFIQYTYQLLANSWVDKKKSKLINKKFKYFCCFYRLAIYYAIYILRKRHFLKENPPQLSYIKG